RNEEGEFELVLANRQLLSVFFIVVILLGVFFTMGYIVGRSSGPVTTADATSPKRSDTKPLVVESPAPAATKETADIPSEDKAPASRKPIVTAAQQPDTAPTPQPVAKAEPPKEEPKTKAKAEPRAEAKAEPPKAETRVDASRAEPASGETYLQ